MGPGACQQFENLRPALLVPAAQLPPDPGEALARWPREEPLAALWSGGDPRVARWTVLGRPTRSLVLPSGAALGQAEQFLLDAGFAGPIARGERIDRDGDTPPFVGGWVGWLGYELGAVLEPRARVEHAPWRRTRAASKAECDWPLAVMQRVDDAWIFDRVLARWWRLGTPPGLEREGSAREGSGRARVGSGDFVRAIAFPEGAGLDALRRTLSSDRAWEGAAIVREYIHAGDVYQVNLAHALATIEMEGSARDLARALFRVAEPWMGGLIECEVAATRAQEGSRRLSVVSASPEMFLSYDPAAGRLRTRPMKGTRPATGDARELASAPKDHAELAMIVDLMRNDLGRVCELGSVGVERPRDIERHAGVIQATATIAGTPRARATWLDAVRAMFPAGSVTGAPKVRAMQIIDELEACDRGPYCGCLVMLSDDGHASASVLIRTAEVESDARDPGRATLTWKVGAGLVADSDPRAEWRETLDKAWALREVLRGAGVEGV
jgi:anthranilate/para-aminobenzoate synthase component I